MLNNILSFLLKALNFLFTRLNQVKPSIRGNPWRSVPFRSAIAKARGKFLDNIGGYYRYKGSYDTHFTRIELKYWKIKLRWTYNKQESCSDFKIASCKSITQGVYNSMPDKFYTMCNQVASLFTQECLGYDLDFVDLTDDDIVNPKELNANKIAKNFSKGRYNKLGERFKKVNENLARTFAAESCLVFGVLHIPGGIGHIAVMNPAGDYTQAGYRTGLAVSRESAFGVKNLPKVKFYVFQKKSDQP